MLAECTIEEARKKYPDIPDRLLKPLYGHIEHGCPTGGFLQAVLSNDLKESLGRADEESRMVLFDIVTFLYNNAPAPCWDSPEKVKVWQEEHLNAEARLAERKVKDDKGN